MTIEAIRVTAGVSIPPDRAFALFTEGFGSWWPREYSWSGEVLDEIGIEPWRDGMCFEIGPYGFRIDWGRVLAWEPPSRILFTWQISPDRQPVPDPRRASEVEIRFTTQDGGTRLDFEHRHFERHGESGAGYRDSLASREGWPYILEQYVQAAAAA